MLRLAPWITLALLVPACGDDELRPVADATPPDATPPDATLGDLGCAADPAPTTAVDPLAYHGYVVDFADSAPVAGAAVALRRTSDDGSLGDFVTDSSGEFLGSLVTGAAPLDLYERVTAASYATTRLYPPRAFSEATTARVGVISTARRGELAVAAGVTLDPAKGAVEIVVVDCAFTRLAGAHVTVSPAPAGGVTYLDDTLEPTPALTGTTTSGTAIAWNVDPGAVDVTVTYAGTTFRARPITVEADGVSVSFRQP